MKELLTVPIIAVLLLSFVGRPIRECAPQLLETDFSEDVNRTLDVLQNMSRSLNSTSTI